MGDAPAAAPPGGGGRAGAGAFPPASARRPPPRAPTPPHPLPPAPASPLAAITANKDLTTYAALVKKAGLNDKLTGSDLVVTVFAPVNSALKGVNVETTSVDDARAIVKQTVIKATAAPLV